MIAALPRRGVFILGATAALTACGFQPVYMPTASGRPGPARRELAAIHVNLLGERPGMLLRQALQDRFEGAGDSTPQRYDLTINYWISGEAIGVQPDSTVTRARVTGTANWVLTAQDPAHTRLINGSARAVDAMNQLDSQIFAIDMENQTIYKRLAESIADQISLQLAAYFRKRAASASAS